MPGTTRLGQIAGRVYGQNDAFNYYVFSSKMTPKDQLSLLKRLDLRYSEAERLTVASVLKKVLRFIDRVQPDYLVSWDNRLDLSVLNQEANPPVAGGNQSFLDQNSAIGSREDHQ